MTSFLTSSPLWTRDEVVTAVTGGTYGQDWHARNLTIDSRDVQSGDLFIALHGKNSNGHDHLLDVAHKGAVAVVIDHWPEGLHQANFPIPVIMVKCTLQALWDLGKAARARMTPKITAITGSVGKTTTKAALAHILESQGLTSASAKSLNTKIGVPLSLARSPRETQYGVFEIGMSLPGEIAPLSTLVSPDIAVITMIAPAHLEGMKTLEAIADEKISLARALGKDGIVILNHDMPLYDYIRARMDLPVWTYGKHKDADLRLIDAHFSAQKAYTVTAQFKGEAAAFNFTLNAIGEHMILNSLGALLAAKGMGADILKSIQTLNSFRPQFRRGGIEVITFRGKEMILLDESYNANPTSMRAALESLACLRETHPGRTVAILGDMRELGNRSTELHTALSHDIKRLGIDVVYTCGPLMKNLAEALSDNTHRAHKEASRDLADLIISDIQDRDIIMVKGSLSMQMDAITEALRNIRERDAD